MEPRPARLNTPETLGMFRLFASLIGFHLDDMDRPARSEAVLLDAHEAERIGKGKEQEVLEF